jgi:hypothetical protein
LPDGDFRFFSHRGHVLQIVQKDPRTSALQINHMSLGDVSKM